MSISTSIIALKKKLDILKEKHLSALNEYNEQLKSLSKLNSYVSEYWRNSWVNADHYNDFIKKDKSKIIGVNYEDLYSYINQKSDLNFQDIDEGIRQCKKEVSDFNEEVIVEMSPIRGEEKYINQLAILKKLEKYKWEIPSTDFLKENNPGKVLIQASEIRGFYNKPLLYPPHMEYDSKILASASIIDYINQYFKLAYRLLRECELLQEGISPISNYENNPLLVLNKIVNAFHDIAKQLMNRYDNRSTIHINDEYDVQDLLYALLKIEFSDVRKEEFSPSSAGANSKIDFLLKKEKIIIEVKKTRPKLKDRKLGEELLIDIGRYKNHPDCLLLYCFVYDPENLLHNPEGLINDLEENSTDEMQVIVQIKP